MQDKIFYTICFGFLSGVFLRSFVLIDSYSAILFGGIALGVLLFFTLVSKNNWAAVAAIFILTLSIGIWRFGAADIPNPAVLESKVGQKISLAGEIADEPKIKENSQQLVVFLAADVRILTSVGLEENYKYGDEINFEGILKKPENFITDQGKIFDYANYLRKDGILYVMSYPEVEIVSWGNGNPVKRALFWMKEKFLEKINFAIAQPESLLMGGLILGERAAFSDELKQNFINTGTIHIVALSGYNVMIVAEWLMKFFAFLPKNFGFGAGIFSIILFVLMTGASSTAVRAGIMASLALVARATGRDYDVARALGLACVVMVLLNPFVLVYDVSFQLSFMATIAVIFFTPRLEKYFLWVTKSFGLRDTVSVTAAAYIFVFPFILYKMGNFSLVALPANILVLPFIPATMAAGFLTGFFGMLWYGLAVPLGFISYLLLHYELGVINFLANFPLASFTTPYFPLIITISIYIYFVYMLFGRSIKSFFRE